jgi:hypothetical protein
MRARVMRRADAEIEHQLLIEYLFAASSVADSKAGSSVADIAVEEMGHLLTIDCTEPGDVLFGIASGRPGPVTFTPHKGKIQMSGDYGFEI